MIFQIEQEYKNLMGIYRIINSLDKRDYVGSAQKLKKRYQEHIGGIKKKKHHSKKLQRFVNKYGIETLSFTLLELVTDPNQLITREQYWLDFYKSAKYGFNICPTAGNCRGRYFSDESKDRSSKTQGTQILQFSLNGEFLKEWQSMKQIKKVLKIDTKTISYNCQGKYQTAGNFIWRYKSAFPNCDIYIPSVEPQENGGSPKSVLQFSLDGIFIKEWDYIKLAAKELNIIDGNISSVCKGKSNTAGSFIWRYKTDFKNLDTDKIRVNPEIQKGIPRSIIQYDLNGIFIKEWESLKKAAEELGLIQIGIWRTCQRKKEQYKNFIWRYKSDPII